MYGIKTEWDDAFSEAYDEVYDDDDTPVVLFEALGGDYMIFGYTLFDSGDMRWGFEKGDVFKEINLSGLSDLERKYKLNFIEKFPQFAYLMAEPFCLMTFVHFS